MSYLDDKSMLDLLVELDQMECGERPPRRERSARDSMQEENELKNLLWVRPFEGLRDRKERPHLPALVTSASASR